MRLFKDSGASAAQRAQMYSSASEDDLRVSIDEKRLPKKERGADGRVETKNENETETVGEYEKEEEEEESAFELSRARSSSQSALNSSLRYIDH